MVIEYIGIDSENYLFRQFTCFLSEETPKRINQKDYKPQFHLFKKHRKTIETLFSEGFKTRILTKITTLTIIQFINKKTKCYF